MDGISIVSFHVVYICVSNQCCEVSTVTLKHPGGKGYKGQTEDAVTMDDLLALDGFSSSFSFLPSCIDIKHYFTNLSKTSRARIRRTAFSFFKRSYVHNRMASGPEKKYSGTALVSLQRPDLIISASRAYVSQETLQ